MMFLLPLVLLPLALSADGETASGVSMDLPIWHPLTAWEQQVVVDNLAAPDDPDHLLRLALLLGGEVRSEQQAAKIIRTLARFREEVAPALAEESDARARAQLLFTRFHQDLLHTESDGSLSANYRVFQSRLDLLLTSSVFNCTSSAVAYGLLALYEGYDVLAVQMPAHVFLQMGQTSWAAPVEVETTTPTGFGILHDEAFYAQQAAAWSAERGLPPSTWEQYQARAIQPFRELVAMLGIVRHETSTQGAELDRMVEISGLLLPQEPQVQSNRLVAWQHAAIDLQAEGDYTRLRDMAARLEPAMEQVLSQVGELVPVRRTASTLTCSWARAEVEQAAPDMERLAHLLARTQSLDDPDNPHHAVLLNNMDAAIAIHGTRLLEAGRLEEAQTWFNRLDPFMSDREALGRLLATVHLRQGNILAEQGAYDGALASYHRCFDEDFQGERMCRDNSERIFLLRSNDHLQQADYQGAVDQLAACLVLDPTFARCGSEHERIRQWLAEQR